jgi:hypothetical protein
METSKVKSLVEKEILTCQTALVEDLLTSTFSYDNVTNLYREVVAPNQYRYIVDVNEGDEFSATIYEINENGDDVEVQIISNDDATDLLAQEVDIYSGEEVLTHYGYDYNTVLESSDEFCTPRMIDSNDSQEICEWWLVTEWLAGELEKAGAPMFYQYGQAWWGRTTAGQAIKNDYIIQKISGEIE